MTISLAMIVKDGLEDLKRLQPLVQPHIDEWVVVFPPGDKAIAWAKKNGIKAIVSDHTQPIEEVIHKEITAMGIDLDKDHRLFNFASARNESFSNATGDYVMWLDADDTPIGLDRLKEVLRGKQKADYIDVVYDYARDREGNSISDQVRERIIKNDKRFKWAGGQLGLIHETIVTEPGFTPISYKMEKKDFYIQHNSDHQEASSDRNFMALLYEYLKTDGKDPRTTYYLGTELFNHKFFSECIKIMQEYVQVGGWDEERFRAYIRMAEAYHQLGDKESSRNAYLKAQTELPDYPESYMGLAESYFSDEDWSKTISYTVTGLQKPLPKTKSAIDMMRYTFRPLTYMALSYLSLGKPGDAYEWFERAYKSNPKHPWINQYKGLFLEAKDLDDYVKSFVKVGQIAKRRYPETLSSLAESVPEDLKDQELLLAFTRKNTKPKIWPDNSIVYFCSTAFEEWGPDSLETGAGGSEEAVINLTKRWAAMGMDVTVYNNCPEEKTVDGVKWVRYERFNPRDMFNILISWRNNPFMEEIVASTKLIDVHDVPSLQYFSKKYLKDVTLMVKSEYHKSLFPHLPDSKFQVINNGIDPKQFENPEKVKNSVVWTSSYDRGLEYLLEMWEGVMAEVPDATLDIYYGWNLFDQSPYAMTDEGIRWKLKMQNLMMQPGIRHHGRVNTHEIAKAYKRADVWAYPTNFPEIDCITATKAMAAKCVPITTDYAVMKERNQGVIVKGDIADNKDVFKNKLIQILKDEDLKESIRGKLDVSEYSWDSVADRWVDNF